MIKFSNNQMRSFYYISVCSMLVYIFLMVNACFLFAQDITIDRLRFTDTDGAESTVDRIQMLNNLKRSNGKILTSEGDGSAKALSLNQKVAPVKFIR